MKNFKMIAALAVAVAATSCSNDDLMTGVENNAQNNGAIGVNTFIANGTRGVAYDNVDEFRDANGNFDLYAWEKLADDAGYKTPAFMEGVAFVMGTDQPSTWYYEDKGEVRFWQELGEGSTVDFYAVSPKDVAATIEAETQTIEYTVEAESKDQVDLMYARTTGVEPGEEVKKNGVHLDFNHALSQIVFKAKTREDYVDYVSAEIKEVRVVNVANTGTFTFDKASYPVENGGTYNETDKQPWSNVAGTAAYTAQIGWNAETEENSVMTVNTGLNGDETVLTNSQSALILMPQETTAAEVYDRYTAPTEGAYFAVTCQVVYHRPTTDADGNETTTPVYIVGDAANEAEGTEATYETLYFPLETTWNAGYKYTYTFVFSADVADPITINEDLYVGPWGDGGETEVEIHEDELYVTDKSQVQPGYIAYRDGTFDTPENFASRSANKQSEAAGVVYYIFGSSGYAQPEHSEYTTGLIIALSDASDEYIHWSDDTNSTVITDDYNYQYVNGYTLTQIIKEWNETNPDKLVLPYEAIVSWAESNPAPEQTSGWYIPSLRELALWVCPDTEYISWGSRVDDFDRTNIDKWIDDAGGAPLKNYHYWPCNEWSTNTALTIAIGDGYMTNHWKTNGNYVRAVCAF